MNAKDAEGFTPAKGSKRKNSYSGSHGQKKNRKLSPDITGCNIERMIKFGGRVEVANLSTDDESNKETDEETVI